MAHVLLVDDDPLILQMLTILLEEEGYTCTAASSAAEARPLLDQGFDLALVDVMMPNESGIELLTHIRTQYPSIAVVMVTGVDDRELVATALETGAYGYVVKPFRLNEIRINVTNALHRRRLELDNLARMNELEVSLEQRTLAVEEVSRRLEETKGILRSLKEETALKLAQTIELRHEETGKHILRVGLIAQLLARRLGFSSEESAHIGLSSLLHDVGKIAVPDKILLKPGKLTANEFEVVKRHTHVGYELLKGSESDVLRQGGQIALSHHEWWDGNGYPLGLAGDEIPQCGRIAAVADVCDALASRRRYRGALPLGTVLEVMEGERGSHFDPEIFDLFQESMSEVSEIINQKI